MVLRPFWFIGVFFFLVLWTRFLVTIIMTQTNSEASPAHNASTQSNPSPSTSTISSVNRTIPYDQWQVSPIKEYLKISDSTIITCKALKIKAKTPPGFFWNCLSQTIMRIAAKKIKS